MGKTIRKIGEQGAKKKIPVVEGTAYAEAHDITLRHNCRCDGCTGKRKQKKNQEIIEKLDQTDLEDFLSDMNGFN